MYILCLLGQFLNAFCELICYISPVPIVMDLVDIVLPRIFEDWKSIAIDLEFEQNTISVIQQSCRNDSRSSCMQMLSEWIFTENGLTPKTWATLLFTLKQMKKLNSACIDIENDLASLPMYVCLPLQYKFYVTLSLVVILPHQNYLNNKKVNVIQLYSILL